MRRTSAVSRGEGTGAAASRRRNDRETGVMGGFRRRWEARREPPSLTVHRRVSPVRTDRTQRRERTVRECLRSREHQVAPGSPSPRSVSFLHRSRFGAGSSAQRRLASAWARVVPDARPCDTESSRSRKIRTVSQPPTRGSGRAGATAGRRQSSATESRSHYGRSRMTAAGMTRTRTRSIDASSRSIVIRLPLRSAIVARPKAG